MCKSFFSENLSLLLYMFRIFNDFSRDTDQIHCIFLIKYFYVYFAMRILRYTIERDHYFSSCG